METIVTEAAARAPETGATTVEIGGIKATMEEFVAAAETIAPTRATVHASFAKDRLRSFIERVERLEEEKKAAADDIKEVYAEAKGEGYDVKIMREVVRLRKLDPADFQERDALLDIYLRKMGMRT
jgi:uncharacterized protein (UPF0335 family)